MCGQKSLSEVIFADHSLWLIYRWNVSKKHGYIEETMQYRAFHTPLWQMKQRKNESNMVNVKIVYQYFKKIKWV